MNSLQFNKIFNLVIALVPVIAVLFPKLIGLAFILWILIIITGVVKKEVRFVRPSPLGFLFLGLFLLYLFGVIFTNHPDIAGKQIEYKLSIVLMPFLFVFQPKVWRQGVIKSGFVLAVLVLSIYQIAQLAYFGSIYNGMAAFTSSNFSTVHHPSYFSAFAFLAMLLSLEKMTQSPKKKHKIIFFTFVLFFILIQFLCMSLAGLLFLMLFFVLLGIYFSKRVFGLKGIAVALILLPLALISAVQYLPSLKTQLDTSKQYLEEYIENPTQFVQSKKTYLGGNETRLILWTASVQEIALHPFGVGTGNVDDHLESRLQKLSHFEMAAKKYNPHNQFLQTSLEVGFFGTLLLLTIVVYSFSLGIGRKNWILVLLTLNFIFNCLFESMLQRQSGIVFYTFWLLLFVILQLNRTEKEKINQ